MLVNSLIETDRIGDLGLVVVDEVGYKIWLNQQGALFELIGLVLSAYCVISCVTLLLHGHLGKLNCNQCLLC